MNKLPDCFDKELRYYEIHPSRDYIFKCLVKMDVYQLKYTRDIAEWLLSVNGK